MAIHGQSCPQEPARRSRRPSRAVIGSTSVRYLSDEWIAAADRLLREHSPRPSVSLTIVQQVDGLCRYRIVISPSATRVETLHPDEANDADAVFIQSAETATNIARGETDAHQAFLLGKIDFEGSIETLIECRDAFGWLAEAFAPLMAETSFAI